MVMHKLAPLPDICLKSNVPATRRLKRKLQWHHPAFALTLLISPLIYIVIALIMTKRATIHVPMTEEWFTRRKTRMLIAWSVCGLGLLCFVAGIALAASTDTEEFLFLLIPGIFLLIGAALYGQYACRMIWPKRITNEYLWLNGVHPGFLDRLEVFPYVV